jgi:hypothetical protein
MQVFVFDWLAYGENVDKFRVDGELPRLGGKHFNPQVAVDTYTDHLDAWVEMERQGFDGLAINEHHGTPYGLGNSPNLVAAAIALRAAVVLTQGPAPAQTADAIHSGGPIVRVNDGQPSAEAVAVKDGRIVAVGTRAEVEKAHKGAATKMVDLKGRTARTNSTPSRNFR